MYGGFRRECACCGITCDECDMRLLADGQAVCDDCIGSGAAAECDGCGELFLSEDLTDTAGKQLCADCLARETPDLSGEDGAGHVWTLKDLNDLYLGRQTAYRPGETVEIRWPSFTTGAEYRMSLTVDGQGRISEISPVTGQKTYPGPDGNPDIRPFPVLSENYVTAMACIRQILTEQSGQDPV